MLLIILSILLQFTKPQHSCLKGYLWNQTLSQCYPAVPTCFTGYLWDGGNCVPPIICPNSTYYIGNFCHELQKQCPTGFYQWRNSCINCPSGFNFNMDNQSCVWIGGTCSSGLYWNGVNCVLISDTIIIRQQPQNEVIKIPGIQEAPKANLSVNSSKSLSSSELKNDSLIVNSKCPQNFKWNGSVCLSHPSEGEVIQVWNTTKLDSNGNIIITTNSILQCLQGYYFNGKNCSPNRLGNQCIPGYKWNENICIAQNQTKTVTKNTNNQVLMSNQIENLTSRTKIPDAKGNEQLLTRNLLVEQSVKKSDNSISNSSVLSSTPCIAGYYFNGRTCISLTFGINCLGGYIWNSTTCIEYVGNSLNKRQQQLVQIPVQTTLLKLPIIPCATGFVFNGQICVPLPTISNCLNGFIWNGSTCVVYTGKQTVLPISNRTSTSQSSSKNIISQNTQNPKKDQSRNQFSNTYIPTQFQQIKSSPQSPNSPIYNSSSQKSQTNILPTKNPLLASISPSNNNQKLSTQKQNPSQSATGPVQRTNLQPKSTPQLKSHQAVISNSKQEGWKFCTDIQYWNGKECVQYKGLMNCLPGYFWNWTFSRCG